ncbi:hypothetical protein BU15DRAFT_72145 [Melanogaster broomeanus]|nr:hypothetical protein BU15DRAFT_72145 [Melanogaster broomeanus]
MLHTNSNSSSTGSQSPSSEVSPSALLTSPLTSRGSDETSRETPKHPECLRENYNVTDDSREKIKCFLASQGMIKGHSGPGPRSSEPEP